MISFDERNHLQIGQGYTVPNVSGSLGNSVRNFKKIHIIQIMNNGSKYQTILV